MFAMTSDTIFAFSILRYMIPFILVNSISGITGASIAGFSLPADFVFWVFAAVAGGAIGSYLGARKYNRLAIKYVLSLVMLIGLLAKNAILIVEYALQRRKAGMSIVKAAISGALARLRPILMTSFAFIFGLLPLALAHGAGAIGNKSIGISAIGGMLIGTIIGVLIIPVLFIMFQSLQERVSKHKIVTTDDNLNDINVTH